MRIVNFDAATIVPRLNLEQPIELAGTRQSGITLTSRVLAILIHSYFNTPTKGVPLTDEIPLVLMDDESTGTSLSRFMLETNLTGVMGSDLPPLGVKRLDCLSPSNYEQLIDALDEYPVAGIRVVGLSLATVGCTATELGNLRAYFAKRPDWKVVMGLHKPASSGHWSTRNDVSVYNIRKSDTDSGLHILTINRKGEEVCTGFTRSKPNSQALMINPAQKLEIAQALNIEGEKVTVVA